MNAEEGSWIQNQRNSLSIYHEPSTKNSENLIKLEVYINYETIEEPQIK